uniref:Lipase n=1 Tax=Heterorhabditis bacteriophora TaxID=37862 RepID=A0A1I7XQF6_HETBA
MFFFHGTGMSTVNGGIVEWDRHGAGVDIGSRASVADDLLKLKWTLFGVNVGPTSSRTLVGPNTVGHGKGSAVKTGTLSGIYNGYYNQPGDWYRNQFKKPSLFKDAGYENSCFSVDEFRTPSQRACPWCFAVDSTYPVQRLFP